MPGRGITKLKKPPNLAIYQQERIDMLRVFIIEDETLLRDLIGDLLKSQIDLELAGSSGDGLDGYKKCLKLKPDFVILDLRLPTLNGVEVAQRLKADRPATKILVFSGLFSLSLIRRVMKAKVNGVIEKSAGLAEMEKAIRAVASGQTYFGPEIVNMMPDLFLDSGRDESVDSLTSREREILQLIGEGYTTKEIAWQLFISPGTADTHRNNLMKKLGVHNVAGLTRHAIALALFPFPPARRALRPPDKPPIHRAR